MRVTLKFCEKSRQCVRDVFFRPGRVLSITVVFYITVCMCTYICIREGAVSRGVLFCRIISNLQLELARCSN